MADVDVKEGADAPKGKLVKADDIAAKFRADIEASVKAFSAKSRPTKDDLNGSQTRKPTLVGILATDSKPSAMYAEFTKKTCDAIGVNFVLKKVGGAIHGEGEEKGVNGEGVEEAIMEANDDSMIDGVMVSQGTVNEEPLKLTV